MESVIRLIFSEVEKSPNFILHSSKIDYRNVSESFMLFKWEKISSENALKLTTEMCKSVLCYSNEEKYFLRTPENWLQKCIRDLNVIQMRKNIFWEHLNHTTKLCQRALCYSNQEKYFLGASLSTERHA